MGTLTASNYYSLVRARLKGLTVTDDAMLQFANDTNREIALTPLNGAIWPFMQSNFSGTLTVGEIRYDFETDWQQPVDMTITAPDAKAYYPRYIPYEQYRQKYPDPTAGTQAMPTYWTVWGRTFLVGPTPPDDDYTLDMAYVKLPTNIDASSDTLDIPDEWSELVVLGMLKRCLMLHRRFDQAQVIAQDLDPEVAGSMINRMIVTLTVPQRGLPARARSGWFGR